MEQIKREDSFDSLDVEGSIISHGREGQERPMSRLGRGPPSAVGSVASLEILSKYTFYICN